MKICLCLCLALILCQGYPPAGAQRGPPPPVCEKMFTRQDVSSSEVTNNLDSFNKAMKAMKEDLTWEGFPDIGTYHGRPFRCSKDQKAVGNANGCCIDHWSQESKRENFVTWHRLYTYNMEQSLIKHSVGFKGLYYLLVGNLAMPYWDWTNPQNSDVELPLLALQGEWTNGPLPNSRTTSRNFPNLPQKYRTTDYFRGLVKTSFKQTNYVQFNQQIVLPHNLIHVLIGGDMGAPSYASYDPIFYLHHSYVDLQFAYYQEVQRLRHMSVKQKSFCKQAQSAPLQPFSSKYVNPFTPSRDNSIGYQTLDYQNNFCYNFDNLLFEGLTPKEFIERDEQEMKKPSILAAVAIKTTGFPSTVSFELTRPSSGSLATGAFHSLGKGQDATFSEYNSYLQNYFDFTDMVSQDITTDLTVKVKITDVTNAPVDSAYQPMVVYRPANSRQHTYRIHVADIKKYAPVIHGQPGAKLQFLEDNGDWTTDNITEYMNDANGVEIEVPINIGIDQDIKYNEHKFKHVKTGTNITVGHGSFFECDASGDPTCNPEYFNQGVDAVTVLHWDVTVNKQYVTAYTGRQILLLAWCPGQYANVIQLTKDDYYNCENLDPTGARNGPASFLVPTDVPGTYYYASGVKGACKKGWKVTVEVRSTVFHISALNY